MNEQLTENIMKHILKSTLVVAAVMAAALPSFAQNDAKKDAQTAAAEAAKLLAETPQTEVKVPKPVYWTNTLTTTVNFNQTSLTSWAAGGYNNYVLNSLIRGSANWAREKKYWNNSLEVDYGFIYSKDKPIIQKNADRIKIISTWGYKVTDKLNYTVNFVYNSQLANGWTYNTPAAREDGSEPSSKDWRNARTLRAGFASPGYMTIGGGIAWVPNKWLTVNFSPLTGSTTIVGIEKLRKNYGMSRKKDYEDTELFPDEKDEDNKYWTTGKYYRPISFAFGAQLITNAKFKINNKIDISSNLILFSNYLKNPQNFRVNWDNTFVWKLNKYFSMTFTSNLIYDDTVLIIEDGYENGHKAIQLKEFTQFGFTYSFTNKK